VYNPRPEDTRVTVELPATAAWVAESFPAERVEDLPDGGQRVVLAVSQTTWLERVLLRAGPEARVVDPPELRGLAAAAARRVRSRYAGA
jgi:proteasome accessory factor C